MRKAERVLWNHDMGPPDVTYPERSFRGVDDIPLYPGRVLASTYPGDIVQMHPDLKPELPHILRHYEAVGLQTATDIIWNYDPRQLAEHDGPISISFFHRLFDTVRPNAFWYSVADRMNSKNNFIHLAKQLGTPIPETYCYRDKGSLDLRHLPIPFPFVLKTDRDASGAGVWVCQDWQKFLTAYAEIGTAEPFQIQQCVESDTWLNVMYHARNGSLERVVVTQQILKGTVHNGNRFPARVEPFEATDAMARWMAEQGMEDYFAFDLVVTSDEQALVVECNPRWNGATYMYVVADRLGATTWCSKNFKTRHHSIADIELGDLAFNRTSGKGAVIVNWGPVLGGKIGCLLVGDPATQEALTRDLETLLS